MIDCRAAGDPPAGRDGSTSLLATGGRAPSRFGGPNSDNPRLCELAGPGPGLLVLCRSTLSRAVAFEVRCLARAPVRVRRSGRVRELPITRPSLRSSFGHRRPCGHPGNDPTAKRTPLGHGPRPSRATRRHRYTGQPEEDDHEHSRSGRSDSDAAAGLAQPGGRCDARLPRQAGDEGRQFACCWACSPSAFASRSRPRPFQPNQQLHRAHPRRSRRSSQCPTCRPGQCWVRAATATGRGRPFARCSTCSTPAAPILLWTASSVQGPMLPCGRINGPTGLWSTGSSDPRPGRRRSSPSVGEALGPRWRRVQDQANSRGVNRAGVVLAVDGIFGRNTDGWVRAFQSAIAGHVIGFREDGVVGPLTWSLLLTGEKPNPLYP